MECVGREYSLLGESRVSGEGVECESRKRVECERVGRKWNERMGRE